MTNFRFNCESPLHIGDRSVHSSEGGCDEIEDLMGIALCASCWCKYDKLIGADESGVAAFRPVSEDELIELIASSPVALRRLIAEMRLSNARLTQVGLSNLANRLYQDRERATYLRLSLESKEAITDLWDKAAQASHDAMTEVFRAQNHLNGIGQ